MTASRGERHTITRPHAPSLTPSLPHLELLPLDRKQHGPVAVKHVAEVNGVSLRGGEGRG